MLRRLLPAHGLHVAQLRIDSYEGPFSLRLRLTPCACALSCGQASAGTCEHPEDVRPLRCRGRGLWPRWHKEVLPADSHQKKQKAHQKNVVETVVQKRQVQKNDRFAQQIRAGTMGDAVTDEELPRSEYELQTQGNIAQNKRKLQQLGLDKPAIKTKAAPKAKTPSAAAAASTMVTLRGRTAAAAEPIETGEKGKATRRNHRGRRRRQCRT